MTGLEGQRQRVAHLRMQVRGGREGLARLCIESAELPMTRIPARHTSPRAQLQDVLMKCAPTPPP